jgi:hypothetical protein
VAPGENSAGRRRTLRGRILRDLLLRSAVAASRRTIRRARRVAARRAAGRRSAIGIDPGVAEASQLEPTIGTGLGLPHGAVRWGDRCCPQRNARGCTLGRHRAARAVRERLDAQGGNEQLDRSPPPPALLHAVRNLRPAIRENLGQRNLTPPKQRNGARVFCAFGSIQTRRIELKLRSVTDLAARRGNRRHGIIWQYLVPCSASGIAERHHPTNWRHSLVLYYRA